MYLFRVLFLLLMIVATTGCTKKIQFQPHYGYRPSYTVPSSAILTFPENSRRDYARLSYGPWFDKTIFKVPVHDAYRAEALPRFGRVFTGGVGLSSNEEFERVRLARRDSPENRENRARQQSELDDLFASLDGIGSGETRQAQNMDEQRTMDERMRDLREREQERIDYDYWIKFEEILIGYPETRSMVLFEVSVIDLRTGNTLHRKSYQGISQALRPSNASHIIERRIYENTKYSFSAAFSQLMRDMEETLR